MRVFKVAKWTVLAAAVGYAAEIRALDPTIANLLNPQWHAEAPLRIAMRRLTMLLPRLYGRYGERGVRALQFVFYKVGLDRAPLLKEALDIDVEDARSLGRVLDYEDGLVGVKGIWTEENCGRAVKKELYCPAAAELAACPQVCTSLVMAMEAGTFAALDPRLKMPELTELLSRGDDCCLAVIELPSSVVGRRKSGRPSPQATPGRFPPRLDVPGLRKKLAVTGISSVFRAALRMVVSGPDQPMEWYEYFRYTPQT